MGRLMPTIDSPQEAQSLARLIQQGKLTGDTRDTAMAALRTYDASGAKPPIVPAAGPSYWDRLNQTGAAVDQAARSGGGGALGSLGRTALGAGEDALSMVSGLGGDVAGALTSIATQNPQRGDAVRNALTYTPRTATGQAGLQYAGAMASPLTSLLNSPAQALQNAGHPILAQGVRAAEDVAPAFLPKGISAIRGALSDAEAPTIGGINSPQSLSAAAASPALAGASPELQQAVRNAAQRGGAVNQDVLTRHLEADSLPVKIQLTQGQATQDPTIISQERNLRAKYPALADKYNQQNGQLVQNVQAIRDAVGPEVFSANPVDHGESLISAYKAKDTAAQADISAKYKALSDANGGDLPMDGRTFARTAQTALKQDMKAPFLPGSVQKIVDGFADGEPMTFTNFENLRTILAAEARKADRAGDGNASRAISVVRDSLENMPISSDALGVKALADEARSAARARFQAMDADPAYKAAVDDSVPADRFVQRFITGPSATRDGVATMRTNLADQPSANQTMAVAALDHLKKAAGISDDWTGNFRQGGFNKALQALSPKLGSLLDPKTAETLDRLGRVSRNVAEQPVGSSVNNSNTAVAALANQGKNALESVANVAAHGVPVGTWARRGFDHLGAGRFVKQATAPGAGLLHMPPKTGLLP